MNIKACLNSCKDNFKLIFQLIFISFLGGRSLYRLFKLQETNIAWDLFGGRSQYLSAGKEGIKETLSDKDCEKFISMFFKDGQINFSGEELINAVFPTFRRNVFISHSHDDKNLTYAVAGLLKKFFDLTVFIDEYFWGSANGLLKYIDKKHCKIGNNLYSYENRNLTTSHVHTMLSTAIMRAIDQCELILFLGTDNSAIPDIDEKFEKGEYTMSPWIYQEISFASLLPSRDWEWYRGDNKEKVEIIKESCNIAYELPPMVELNSEDLVLWKKEYNNHRNSMPQYYNALNYLYKIKKNKVQAING